MDVMEQLDRWRADGGPALWCAAMDRVLAAYRPVWTGRAGVWSDALLPYGAAGVAMAIYILAAEQDAAVEDITVDQVRALYGRGSWDDVRVWETMLRGLGHDPDEATDPVMARWRELRQDLAPADPGRLSDAAWEDASILLGPRLANGIDRALAPRWAVQL